jgi:hypothetical protein
MVAEPVVPAPVVVMPTTPPVSPALAITAVEGVPVSFVRVLRVVPVDAAFATLIVVCAVPLLLVPHVMAPVPELKFRWLPLESRQFGRALQLHCDWPLTGAGKSIMLLAAGFAFGNTNEREADS